MNLLLGLFVGAVPGFTGKENLAAIVLVPGRQAQLSVAIAGRHVKVI